MYSLFVELRSSVLKINQSQETIYRLPRFRDDLTMIFFPRDFEQICCKAATKF